MEELDFWRLNESLTVIQAALLVAGASPGSLGDYVEHMDLESRPGDYEAAKYAIRAALLAGKIEGRIVEEVEFDSHHTPIGYLRGSADIRESSVDVESLRSWLLRRGFRTGFFFPESAGQPDYLDHSHARYSPKLAAAVRAWLAIDSVDDLKGRHPKQAILKWLRENAANFDLTDVEGKPMESSINEIAKIANWQTKGGAPKTPEPTNSDVAEDETTLDEDESTIDF